MVSGGVAGGGRDALIAVGLITKLGALVAG